MQAPEKAGAGAEAGAAVAAGRGRDQPDFGIVEPTNEIEEIGQLFDNAGRNMRSVRQDQSGIVGIRGMSWAAMAGSLCCG